MNKLFNWLKFHTIDWQHFDMFKLRIWNSHVALWNLLAIVGWTSFYSVSLHLCTGHHLQSTIYNLHCSLSFCSSEYDRVWSSHDIHQTSLRYRTHRPLPDSSELTISRILNAALTSVCMATLFILLPCASISISMQYY